MTPFYHEGLTLLLDSGHFLPYRKCDLGHTISPGRTSKGGDQRLRRGQAKEETAHH